jgi:hypothetical protein
LKVLENDKVLAATGRESKLPSMKEIHWVLFAFAFFKLFFA